MDKEKLLINDNKSNNSEVISNKQIEEMATYIRLLIHSDTMSRGLASLLHGEGYRKPFEGKWIRSKEWTFDYHCSVCGKPAPENKYRNFGHTTKFCPNCGANMIGGVE